MTATPALKNRSRRTMGSSNAHSGYHEAQVGEEFGPVHTLLC
jgi:hypothetical protein